MVSERSIDYERVGLKVGLEIHQQLDTKHKLFCNCPTRLSKQGEKFPEIERFLRVTKSEVGEIDPAAEYEVRKGRKIIYQVPEGHVCLVELDEEPPHDLNKEALTIATAIALALHSKLVDEIYVMRKIVVDGSNTTGFQRTAIVAVGGYVEVKGKRVGIETICLEEDAARKVEEGPGYVKYNLDRLGIPLIEIATSPDIKSPEEAREVAYKIGMLLRLSGKVKRGIGTIRQDLNVSIKGGVKTEIKGVDKLELIPKVVEYEVLRQLRLLELKSKLLERGVSEKDVSEDFIDITDILANSGSKFVVRAIKRGEKAFATPLRKFRNLLKFELQPGRRFGTELADYARAWGGVKGLIHSDELPGYGISKDVVEAIYERLEIDPSTDAFIFIVGPEERVLRALRAVVRRAREAIRGIPKETRAANPDGTTRYMRPQPGAARMYPETDVPPSKIDREILGEAEKIKPKEPEELLKVLTEEHGLSETLASQILSSYYLHTYLDLINDLGKSVEPQLVATTLVVHFSSLKREGFDVDRIPYNTLRELLKEVGEGRLAKEAIPEVLKELSKKPEVSLGKVVSKFKGVGIAELRKIIIEELEKNRKLVRERGERAFSFIMGKVMSKVRGRVDGKVVAEEVRKYLREYLSK